MFCKKCGKEINQGTIFCRFCGEKLVASDKQLKSSTQENQNETNTTNEKTLNIGDGDTNELKKVGILGFVIKLFKGRLRRLDYLLFLLFCIVSIGILSSVFLVAVNSFSTNGEPNGFSVFIIIVIVVCELLFVISGHIRRLHDIEMSGFWVLSLFIPLIGFIFLLILLLTKGTDGVNKYGAINNRGSFFKRVFNLSA